MAPTVSSDRLIIQPMVKAWLTGGLLFSTMALISAVVGVLLVSRVWWVGLVMLVIAAGMAAFVYASLVGYMYADANEVGCTLRIRRWRASRSEVTALWVGRQVYRGIPTWDFARGDGSIAYTADPTVFAETDLLRIAQFLGLRVLDERKKA